MGINIGPEVFQLQMQKVLCGLPGCAVIMDDILVWGKSRTEHDRNLTAVQSRIKQYGLTLNHEKSQICKTEVKFFGHLLTPNGIRPSPEKVNAILEMPPPKTLTELKSLCGMMNYLSKFTEGLATVIKPITDLMKSSVTFMWDRQQQAAFLAAKEKIRNLPSLQYFNVNKKVVVSADASSYGLGAVILQRSGDNLVPIAFASRAMSETERRYSQIERECLASAWACEKFRKYLIGLPEFDLWTDHKPLVPLIDRKSLDQAPLRCQRLLIRLMQFNPVVSHKPGKQLVIADALSRNPVKDQDCEIVQKVESYVDAVMSQLPVSANRMAKLRQAEVHDPELGDVISYVVNGWPTVSAIPGNLKCYYEARDVLSVVDGLLVYQQRLVIPKSQRVEILGRLHESHQGFEKCYSNALRCVWWPGLRKELKSLCDSCVTCTEKRPAQRSEPLRPTPLPSRPWEKIAADLFSHDKKDYLVLIDYYSRWIEVKRLYSTSAAAVINKCRQVFATFGIPDLFMSDNGPQFASAEFKHFAENYGFAHTTSSPYFPQANGEAESAVKIAKTILSSASPDIALLNYRATPHSSTGESPSVALMGRVLNTRIPILPSALLPKLPNDESIRNADNKSKAQAKVNFDRHHGARPLKPLSYGDRVFVRKDNQWSKSGTVISGDTTNRTYLVNTDSGVQRRNRVHLLSVPKNSSVEPNSAACSQSQSMDLPVETPVAQSSKSSVQLPVCSPRRTRLSSGCQIQKPLRYRDE
jgi:hypothetical protein